MVRRSKVLMVSSAAAFAVLIGFIVISNRPQPQPGQTYLEEDGRFRVWDGQKWVWGAGAWTSQDGTAYVFSGRWQIRGHTHLEPIRFLNCPACQ